MQMEQTNKPNITNDNIAARERRGDRGVGRVGEGEERKKGQRERKSKREQR